MGTGGRLDWSDRWTSGTGLSGRREQTSSARMGKGRTVDESDKSDGWTSRREDGLDEFDESKER